MDVTETRTERFETITLALYCEPGSEPTPEATAAAWEFAQSAVAASFEVDSGPGVVLVEQSR